MVFTVRWFIRNWAGLVAVSSLYGTPSLDYIYLYGNIFGLENFGWDCSTSLQVIQALLVT